ncbi:malate dehydrogenase [Candidatus Ishikawella capsulata]|uniref:Malate dehydrogenase n=1 Tax=Candidatus Ishikawaella capsulata Mpkobe TaxID=476281 RepID=C5WCI8_9ENTR|nr:malate dehydrogenase [Candidatus Ishikawaella capsulata]BAH83044.1 malate dehydrogenase [Candidatus Ishikawaella capsulata Mpkobe]
MKVLVLGSAGGVGQSLVLLLKTFLPINTHLVLYDISDVNIGVAIDLSHIPTPVPVSVYSGPSLKKALKGTDITIICAGVTRKPGMQREDLFKINADIVSSLVYAIAHECPKSLIGIITNPVNTTTVIAADILKKVGVYDKHRLFGITTIDLIRSSYLVAYMKRKDPTKIYVPVIGGHSDNTILPLFSQVRDIKLNTDEISLLTQQVRNCGTEVVQRKLGAGSATLAMAYAASRFTLSLLYALSGQSNIYEYAYVEGNTGYCRFFSQPVLLGKNGIKSFQGIGNISLFEQQILGEIVNILPIDISKGEKYVNRTRN